MVLTDGYADWECAFINGIGHGYYGIDIINATPEGKSIRSQGGLHTNSDASLKDITSANFDALVMCGGSIWATQDAPNMTPLILDFLNADKHVAAICGATLALANAGVLNNKHHTSNAKGYLTEHSGDYAGSNLYIDEVRAIDDQNVITAPGHAPAQFSAAVFGAVGIDEKTVAEFLEMLRVEHTNTSPT